MILTVTLNPALDELVLLKGLQLRARNVASARHTFHGGKGFNAAKALAALGAPVTALGFAGRDDEPALARRLAAAGIGVRLVPIERTRSNLKLIDTSTGEETEINQAGSAVTAAELQELDRQLRQELARAAWLVLAGSAAPGVPSDFAARAVRAARSLGVGALVDMSGAPLRAAIEAGPDVVRINRAELAEWCGAPLPDTEAVAREARRLLSRIRRCVVVSLGAAGALMALRGETWLAHPPRRHAVNAVGAGDAMGAGLLAAWQRGLQPPADFRFAVAAATSSVLTLEPGVPDLTALPGIEEQTRVEQLSPDATGDAPPSATGNR